MRSFSLHTIVLLCLAILVVDILAFYWLQSITHFIASPIIQKGIHVAFWTFTIGLISAILFLKIRLDHINKRLRQLYISSLYGLSIASFVPKLIFILIISILYFSAYLFSPKESLILVPIVGLLSGFLPFFVIVFGVFITVYRFKIRSHVVKIKDLPEGFSKLRIVHISDVHLGSLNFQYKKLEKAVELINSLEADFIFFTGDVVNNYAWELKGWEHVLQKMKANRGKFSVLGNHDYGDYSQWKSPKEKKANFELIKYFHHKSGFRLLLNEAHIEKIEGNKLAIIGVENWGKPPFKQYGNLKKALKDVAEIPFKILLSHDPSHWNEEVLAQTDIDLTLSGHTHGMQAGVEFKNLKWSPIKYKYKQWAGLYHVNGQYLYVNRGLGWLGFPGRLGMRPEITLLELEKA